MTQHTRTPDPTTLSAERRDLLDLLGKHRGFLRYAVSGVSDEQAATRPTRSELCLGGVLKHVSAAERTWADFVVNGPGEPVDWESIDWTDPPPEVLAHQAEFEMTGDDTVAGLLAAYDDVAAATDALVATVDLDRAQPLPQAPWFEPGASWTARRAFLHIVAETAQHAGHADIIRETIDGQKTMG
ncbi:DinB family protein [Nocardioides ochotonae]|uniref:DinB family protein n=1 Tax=Nocardioides ochotonae TaxID=2685869 RepID=UPI0014088D52|nr:DinB family protein [Nocardioides ochotonae]